MRPLYLFLSFSLGYSLRLFYRRRLVINGDGERHGRTIYVSNHANSFMDPLVIGEANRPIVHFMTRSDVFKWWLKPVLWASHMLPIYRAHDGGDTKSSNSDTFGKCNDSLRKGRNLLIFGEGFTDDVQIRGLKPVKKGFLKIGFGALEAMNWEKKVYVAPMGVTYTDRNTVGSEFVVNTGHKICLNDYKDAYHENPNRLINELTKVVEERMQECIVYVKDKHWYSLLENVMRITRKGINHQHHEEALSLAERWEYARDLGIWINEQATSENEELVKLSKELESYFDQEKRLKLDDRMVLAVDHPHYKDRGKETTMLLLGWPLALIGLIHGLIPYLLAKTLTEKLFGRKVFWGGVKMMLGKLFGFFYNLPLIILLNVYVFPYAWMGWVYFFFVPMLCFFAWKYVSAYREFRLKGMMGRVDVSKFTERRKELAHRIEELIPVA